MATLNLSVKIPPELPCRYSLLSKLRLNVVPARADSPRIALALEWMPLSGRALLAHHPL